MTATTGRGRRLPPFVSPAIALAMLAAPLCARGLPVPDTSTMARLQERAMQRNRFRIQTPRGEFIVTSLQMNGRGVVVREAQARAALFGAGGDSTGEKRVSWSEVERIAAMRSHSARSGLAGSLVGALAGGAAYASIRHNFEVENGALLIPFGAAIGFGLGAIFGGATGWRILYP